MRVDEWWNADERRRLAPGREWPNICEDAIAHRQPDVAPSLLARIQQPADVERPLADWLALFDHCGNNPHLNSLNTVLNVLATSICMPSLLEVRQLSKSYGDRKVVDALSFSVARGETFGLLGPNGAGKSTTMMMICGVLPADQGEILLDGVPLAIDVPASRRELGVVPQDLAIYPDLTAAENLRFFAKLYGLRGELLQTRVDEALDQVGLTPRAGDLARTFSGGMKRRLNFAASVMHRPRLLILDEPTVGVDPQSRAHLLDCVRSLQETGTAVIYASHYMEEVEAICARAAIIDHGQLLACDTISGLLHDIPLEVELHVADWPDQAQLSLPPDAAVQGNGHSRFIRVVAAHGDSDTMIHESVTRLMNQLAAAELTVKTIRTNEPNLERLFLKLTGHRLRD